ncbi:MAG: hypothetical protein AAFU34_15685 [Pseudomonadota bacterium]
MMKELVSPCPHCGTRAPSVLLKMPPTRAEVRRPVLQVICSNDDCRRSVEMPLRMVLFDPAEDDQMLDRVDTIWKQGALSTHQHGLFDRADEGGGP